MKLQKIMYKNKQVIHTDVWVVFYMFFPFILSLLSSPC